MNRFAPLWLRPGLARLGRVLRDPISASVVAALVGGVIWISLTSSEARARTPQAQPDCPALVSVTQTNGHPVHPHYPRGQLQADLHTLLNMMRYVLTPEPPDITRTAAATA